MKYRIPEPGTTISGFADNNNNKKINPDRPTLDFFLHVNAHIFCVGLIYIFSVVDKYFIF
jgi:hypothetical protein